MTGPASTVRSFKDLRAWQAASVRAGGPDPPRRRFGPANIGEGNGRVSRGDCVRFRRIAHGSLRELETQVMLPRDLGYMRAGQVGRLLDGAAGVGRLLGALIKSLAVAGAP